MIGYITVGTNDLDKSVAFYEALFEDLGAKRFMEDENFVAWATTANGTPGFSVTKPFDGNAASVGNGVMVALMAESKEQVAKLYSKALELGGTDEGEPGPRGEGGFYAAYFRDLDGNKINFFCVEA